MFVKQFAKLHNFRLFFYSFSSQIPQKVKDVVIPRALITQNFCRSSGAGGQHVNKTNSKAEIRFNVDAANWISIEAKKQLKEKYKHYINKEGELILTSQVSRVQGQNLEDAFSKLQHMIFECSQPVKELIFEKKPETQDQKLERA